MLFGVNCGSNMVEDVIYLGMIVVVMEGIVFGVKLIVFF